MIPVQSQILPPNHLRIRLLYAHGRTLGRRVPINVLTGDIVRRFPAEEGTLLHKIECFLW
jgi:hypothetical protein